MHYPRDLKELVTELAQLGIAHLFQQSVDRDEIQMYGHLRTFAPCLLPTNITQVSLRCKCNMMQLMKRLTNKILSSYTASSFSTFHENCGGKCATIQTYILPILICMQNLVKFCPIFLKILRGNKILTSIKGCNLQI